MNDAMLIAACDAMLAYDAALRRRVVDGEIDITGTGGAVAFGDDLNALYDDAARKAYAAMGVKQPGRELYGSAT